MPLPSLDPDLLAAFVAVADERSFTRAAVKLHRTQSAVSMQIKRLEEQLEVELFSRTKTRVVLTAAGESLLRYAKRILALGDEAVRAARGRALDGEIRLGVMDDYGTLVLPPLLASFAAQFPRVHIDMTTGLTAKMPRRLGTDFDVVLALHTEGESAGERLRREPLAWAAAREAIAATDPLPMALYPRGCLLRQWAIDALETARRAWHLLFVSQSPAAVAAVAAQGLAVTIVKARMVPEGLRLLGEREGMPALPTAEVRLHRAPRLSRAGALLADHLAAHLA